ncbi:MAG: diguanylate cyclase domain-containing protein [Huintestinicola sp.]
MKIRFKLILALLVLTAIPTIAISYFSIHRYTDTQYDDIILKAEKEHEWRTEEFSSFFQNIIAAEKETSSLAFIRSYLEQTESQDSDQWSDIPEYSDVADEFDGIVRNSPVITGIYLLNTEGITVASSDVSKIGSSDPMITSVNTSLSKHSGIGNIYTDNSGNLYTTVARRVFSSANKKIGVMYETVLLSQIVEIMNNPPLENYSTVFILDTEGNLVNNFGGNVLKLDENYEYNMLSSALSPIALAVDSEGNDKELKTEYTEGGNSISILGSKINMGEWCIVTLTDNNIAHSEINSSKEAIKSFALLIYIPIAILSIVISVVFTAPVKEIIEIIKRKNNGDTSAKLSIKSNDEFGEISYNFNTMFDNIYESEQRYRTVVSMTDNIIFEVNLKANRIFISDIFVEKFNFRAADDTVPSSFLFKMKVFKDDSARFAADVNAIFAKNDQWEGEYRLKNTYGDFPWVKIIAKKFYDHSNIPSKIIGIIVDIDQEKRNKINLIEKASFDALTRLNNRETFMRMLETEMEESAKRKSLDAFLFVDLDNFKHFNDEYGHACGDEVLKFVADSIKEITYDRGFGGRLGGDEFVFCLTNLTLIGDAGKAAAELIDILDKGFESESTQLHLNIHCSIGIAFFRENGKTPVEIKEAADAAMYNIKKHGKSNFAYAQQETDEKGEKFASDILDMPLPDKYDPEKVSLENADPKAIKLSDLSTK